MFAVGMFTLGYNSYTLPVDGRAWIVIAMALAWIIGALSIWVGVSHED